MPPIRRWTRWRISGALRNFGIRLPLTEIIAQVIFFLILLSFTIQAVVLMGLSAVAALLQDILFFLPRAISAALLLLLGSLLARLLGDTVAAVATNVNISYGRALGKLIEYTIVAFIAVLALARLGIETTVLTTSSTIILASAGIAVALTFALGTREVARNVIAGYYVRQIGRTPLQSASRRGVCLLPSLAASATIDGHPAHSRRPWPACHHHRERAQNDAEHLAA